MIKDRPFRPVGRRERSFAFYPGSVVRYHFSLSGRVKELRWLRRVKSRLMKPAW